MKYYNLLIFLGILFNNSLASCNGNKQIISTQDTKVNNLKKYYDYSFYSSDSLKYQTLFFHEFPNSFFEFNRLYGFSDSAHVLYYESEKHLNRLFTLTKIDQNDYYNKLINLAIDGHWDADAINMLQNGIRSKVFSNTNLTVQLLKMKNEQEIYSFWKFFFDEPHPEEKIAIRLQPIAINYPEMYRVIVKAHEEVLKEKDH